MATQGNTKLNRAGRSHSGWIVRPLNLQIFGEEHFTAVDRVILSALYTFSVKDFCKFTYTELNERYHCSVSSVYRTIFREACPGAAQPKTRKTGKNRSSRREI